MDDLISRQAAIDAIYKAFKEHAFQTPTKYDVCRVINKLPSAEPQKCFLCDKDDVYAPCGARVGTEEQARALLDDGERRTDEN